MLYYLMFSQDFQAIPAWRFAPLLLQHLQLRHLGARIDKGFQALQGAVG